MARSGPREYVFGPRGNIFPLAPPPPRSRGPIHGRTRTSGSIIGQPSFIDLFLARGQKYLRSTDLDAISICSLSSLLVITPRKWKPDSNFQISRGEMRLAVSDLRAKEATGRLSDWLEVNRGPR